MGRILLALACAAWALSAGAQEGYPFRVEFVKDAGGSTLVGINDGPATIAVIVKPTKVENVASTARLPASAVVKPHSRQHITYLTHVDPRKEWNFSFVYRTRFGDYTRGQDALARYRMPYLDGRSFPMIQAPDGPLSTHDEVWSREAVDFAMPEGTLVVAARAGTVVAAVSHHTAGGPTKEMLDKGNYVQVQHDDETTAVYHHLMPNGTAVKVGDTVRAGQIIGYSGNTGFSKGPHLHFGVARVELANDDLVEVSVPVQFTVGKQGMVFSPRTGMAVVADYVGAAALPEPVGREKRVEQVVFKKVAEPAANAAALATKGVVPAQAGPQVPWWIEYWWTLVGAVIALAFLARLRLGR